MDPRYRQLGYGEYFGVDGDLIDWRAVWLDVESIKTGNLLVYVFPDGKTPVVYTGIIYRMLADVPAVHK